MITLQKRILLFSIFLFFAGCGENITNNEREGITSEVIQNERDHNRITNNNDSCEIEPIKKVIRGNSMQPLLQNGDIIYLLPNYYNQCDILPTIGDMVAHEYAGEDIPIIKTVVATEFDSIQIKNKTLWVNEKEVKNSGGFSYDFSEGELKMLSLYIKNGSIPKGSLFILGDNVTNSKDSRLFGAIGVKKLLGKFERE